MTDAGFIFAGYGIVAVTLSAYAWRVLSRGRKLSRQVPEDRRRWT
jgi:hypothetical protein